MSGSFRHVSSLNTQLKFNIIAWYLHYQSYLQYFLNISQHSYPCQALAAFLNIRLPYQQSPSISEYLNLPSSTSREARTQLWVSIILYLHHLIVTGFDKPVI